MYIAAFNPPANTISVTITLINNKKLTNMPSPEENLVNPAVIYRDYIVLRIKNKTKNLKKFYRAIMCLQFSSQSQSGTK